MNFCKQCVNLTGPLPGGRVFGGNCLLFGWRQCIIYGTCRRDGIGRRTGLKIPRWRHRAGSTPAAGTTSEQSPLCSGVFLCLGQKRRHPPAPLLLLFRKRARSARLLGCKRPRDGSLSLPPFCGCLRSKLTSPATRQGPGAISRSRPFVLPKIFCTRQKRAET